jgi:hypothetical protein
MPLPHLPVVYVIAGPNGAGKTTFAREFLPAANVVEFLNADLLAAGLSPLRPGAMAVRSARLLLARWRELVALRRAIRPKLSPGGKAGRRCSSSLKSMTKSKIKSKTASKALPAKSDFAVRAQRAIRKAQHTAARENARYGLPLIVQPAH